MTDKDDLAGSKTPETLEMRQPPKSLLELLAQLREQGADKAEQEAAMNRFLNLQARKRGIPRFGKFALTPLCNLNCKMCYVHLNKDQLNGKSLLSIEQWKQLVKQAIDAGMRYASLSGGECLTYPEFDELYTYLFSFGIRVSVLTNGILLKEKLPLFINYPPQAVQVTIYGSSENAYEHVTGYRAFSKVMDSIRAAKEAKLKLKIAITPNRFGAEDCENLLRLISSMNIPYTINSALYDPYDSTGRKGQSIDMDKDEYISLYRLQAELSGWSIRAKCEDELNVEVPHTGSEIVGRHDGEMARGLLCGGGRSGFSINWDGRMSPCNMLSCGELYPLETGFEECWNTINKFAEAYPRPLECENCAYQKVCVQCVVFHSYGAPVGHANPEICAWGKRLVREGLVVL